jgi:hypothetical protein
MSFVGLEGNFTMNQFCVLTLCNFSNVPPMYGFCILNHQGMIVHIQHLSPEDDISIHDNLLRVESDPELTQTSVSAAAGHKNAGSPLKSKDMPKIIELSASAESMNRLLDR